MTEPARRAWTALAALAAILAITASWWALALWPVGRCRAGVAPADARGLLRRDADGLPNAGGWLLLIGKPLGMLALLAVVWGTELRAGIALRHAADRWPGGGRRRLGPGRRWCSGALSCACAPRPASRSRPVQGATAAQLTRVNDAAPAMALTDQAGQAGDARGVSRTAGARHVRLRALRDRVPARRR